MGFTLSTMTIDDLRNMPEVVIMTKTDVLALAEMLSEPCELLSLKEAAAAYKIDTRTLKQRIKAGIIKGQKEGSSWYVESPRERYKRVTLNQI